MKKSLKWLIKTANDKSKFRSIEDYAGFCKHYLDFIEDGLQARIIACDETNYQFFQYKRDGGFAISRPINSELMILSRDEFDGAHQRVVDALKNIRDCKHDLELRRILNNYVYTCQQSIGATLDACAVSNSARKLNGDLFEQYIRLLMRAIGIDVYSGFVSVPVVAGGESFEMKYQHDLIVRCGETVKAIGSVKTSSKDRIDKIFIDKFLYNRLTGEQIPHFAIFLNDVQRRGIAARRSDVRPYYGINTTFLSGHFKGYTVKLNPLDGVYYCDLRPNMKTDKLLKAQIKTLDNLLVNDIWSFL